MNGYVNVPKFILREILVDEHAGPTQKVIGVYVMAFYKRFEESINQSDIVHTLDVSRSTVAKALKYYVKRGFLRRGEDYRFRIRDHIKILLEAANLERDESDSIR